MSRCIDRQLPSHFRQGTCPAALPCLGRTIVRSENQGSKIKENSSSGIHLIDPDRICHVRHHGYRVIHHQPVRFCNERRKRNVSTRNFLQVRSEEHTSELQSLMRISYAVFCLKTTKNQNTQKKKTA